MSEEFAFRKDSYLSKFESRARILIKLSFREFVCFMYFPQDIEILGWCPAGPVLPHGDKVPL